jgi:hypothetical protein
MAVKERKNSVNINPEQIVALAALQCSMDDIAAFFGCAKSTIHLRFHAEYDRGREKGKMTLRQKQYQLAMGTPAVPGTKELPGIPAVAPNVTMLIWLGKQWLGQVERSQVEVSAGLNVIMGKDFEAL